MYFNNTYMYYFSDLAGGVLLEARIHTKITHSSAVSEGGKRGGVVRNQWDSVRATVNYRVEGQKACGGHSKEAQPLYTFPGKIQFEYTT